MGSKILKKNSFTIFVKSHRVFSSEADFRFITKQNIIKLLFYVLSCAKMPQGVIMEKNVQIIKCVFISVGRT